MPCLIQRLRGGKGRHPPDTRPRLRFAHRRLRLLAVAPLASSARLSRVDHQEFRLELIRMSFSRKSESSLPSTVASTSKPKRVGAVTIPPFLRTLSTKSMIRQSTLPGECRRPRPICIREELQRCSETRPEATCHLAEQIPRTGRTGNQDAVDLRMRVSALPSPFCEN